MFSFFVKILTSWAELKYYFVLKKRGGKYDLDRSFSGIIGGTALGLVDSYASSKLNLDSDSFLVDARALGLMGGIGKCVLGWSKC